MRSIYIGDAHGCREELDELLGLLSIQPEDEVVFLGDLVDRGPDPLGVIRKVKLLNAKCVMGNHDAKHIKYHKRLAEQAAGGPKVKMQTSPEFLATYEQIKEEIPYLASLPYYIQSNVFGPTFAVHAGFHPRVPVHKQDPNVIIRIRNVTKDAMKLVGLREEPKHEGNLVFWADMWTGPLVIYGHSVWKEPRVTFNTIGIDTGCCFGGSLTALVVFEGKQEFVSVKAKKQYCKPFGA